MKLLQIIMVSFLSVFMVNAQNNQCGADPDSLIAVTVSGTAIADSTGNAVHYFLDEDGDDIADYKLNFGPKWYEPDSSDAARPQNGEAITIEGGLSACDSVIIVYSINDEYWRNPYEPYWHEMKPHRYQYGNTHTHHRGYAYGWINSDSITIVTLEGITMVDTTFKNFQYYLDTDADTIPDYFLNFGPPWYNPESLTRPDSGDLINVMGALIEKTNDPVLLVFELNGEVWLDSTGLSTQFGAGWIHKNMIQNRFVHDPFDHASGMEIGSGWNPGNKGQKQLPDSLFCQMLRLYPENIPYGEGEKIAAGYEIGIFTRNQENLMVHNDSVGDHLQLASAIKYQLHYEDAPNGILAKPMNQSLAVKVYDSESKTWETIDSAVYDSQTQTYSFESETAYSLLIIAQSSVTDSPVEEVSALPGSFVLHQNYPNPFNPATTIEFLIPEETRVILSVFNILGQKIAELANANYVPGVYRIEFNAADLSSGIYFYELRAGNVSQIKRMTLVK